jgi:hypothetical protein
VDELLKANTFTQVELDRMVPNAMNHAEVLRLILARVSPSADSMFQLVQSAGGSNVEVFKQILALKPSLKTSVPCWSAVSPRSPLE